ncbi:MAG: hypothetical protein MUO54_12475 [Anaerolineales bacterium]|nr:hypothetical protein [Anaerolineales bacterium]
MKKQSSLSGISALLFPRLGEILLIAIFISIIGFGPKLMNVDGDLGRHITLGDYILTNRTIPTRDVFSHTKLGDPLTPHEWLADVIFAFVHRISGLNGIVWITALLIGVTFWLVYNHSLNLSGMSLLALGGAFLAAAASSLHWLTRPHIFTIFFTVIWGIELEKLRIGIRRSWIIFPLIMLIWVNTHGAFIAGILIWVFYFVGFCIDQKYSCEKFKTLLLIGLSSLLVTLINPDGFGIWKTGFGFLGNSYLVSHTAEYLPPDFQHGSTWPFLLLIVISIVILALSIKRAEVYQVLLISGWTAMALYSARNIPLYAVIVVPILVKMGAENIRAIKYSAITDRFIEYQYKLMIFEQPLKGGFWFSLVIIAVGILLYKGFSLDFQNKGNQFLNDVFPVEAVDWIEENNLKGEGFNYFPWGGYLLYRIWPDKLVFIDGQTDFYGEALTRQYEQVITISPGWEVVLDQYNIDWVLMPTESDLSAALESIPCWAPVYRDKLSEIIIRE